MLKGHTFKEHALPLRPADKLVGVGASQRNTGQLRLIAKGIGRVALVNTCGLVALNLDGTYLLGNHPHELRVRPAVPEDDLVVVRFFHFGKDQAPAVGVR